MNVLQFHFFFSQKCAMRSSSIESNNTTIYNRPILCNSQEQPGEFSFFFFSFWEMVIRIESTATGNSGHRDALWPFGEEKQDKNKDIGKENKQQYGGL